MHMPRTVQSTADLHLTVGLTQPLPLAAAHEAGGGRRRAGGGGAARGGGAAHREGQPARGGVGPVLMSFQTLTKTLAQQYTHDSNVVPGTCGP